MARIDPMPYKADRPDDHNEETPDRMSTLNPPAGDHYESSFEVITRRIAQRARRRALAAAVPLLVVLSLLVYVVLSVGI
jgi:hypothetical protein